MEVYKDRLESELKNSAKPWNIKSINPVLLRKERRKNREVGLNIVT